MYTHLRELCRGRQEEEEANDDTEDEDDIEGEDNTEEEDIELDEIIAVVDDLERTINEGNIGRVRRRPSSSSNSSSSSLGRRPSPQRQRISSPQVASPRTASPQAASPQAASPQGASPQGGLLAASPLRDSSLFASPNLMPSDPLTPLPWTPFYMNLGPQLVARRAEEEVQREEALQRGEEVQREEEVQVEQGVAVAELEQGVVQLGVVLEGLSLPVVEEMEQGVVQQVVEEEQRMVQEPARPRTGAGFFL